MEGNDRLEIFQADRGVDEVHRKLLTSTLDDVIVYRNCCRCYLSHLC